MNKSQFEALRPYENTHLRTAKLSYIRGLYEKDAKILHQIYMELGHNSTNIHCAACMISVCKVLAKAYDEYKNQMQESISVEDVDEIEESGFSSIKKIFSSKKTKSKNGKQDDRNKSTESA